MDGEKVTPSEELAYFIDVAYGRYHDATEAYAKARELFEAAKIELSAAQVREMGNVVGSNAEKRKAHMAELTAIETATFNQRQQQEIAARNVRELAQIDVSWAKARLRLAEVFSEAYAAREMMENGKGEESEN